MRPPSTPVLVWVAADAPYGRDNPWMSAKRKKPKRKLVECRCDRCGRTFMGRAGSALCPDDERLIEEAEAQLAQHPAGTGRRRAPTAKRVTGVVSGGAPGLGKK
jgi:hypothetical protein